MNMNFFVRVLVLVPEYMHSLKSIYCGKDTGVSATAIAIVECLIVQAELTGACGRTLYTDNWYTSIDLALMLYQKYVF